MIRVQSQPNEAHEAAAMPVFHVNKPPAKRILVHTKQSACNNPHCVVHRRKFVVYRIVTTVVMLMATGTGIVSYFAGNYVLTFMSPLFGMLSHVIDTWVLDTVKNAYERSQDIILEGFDDV